MTVPGYLEIKTHNPLKLGFPLIVKKSLALESETVNLLHTVQAGENIEVDATHFDHVDKGIKANGKLHLKLRQGKTFNRDIATPGELEIDVPSGSSNPVIIKSNLLANKALKMRVPKQTIYLGEKERPVDQTCVASIGGKIDLQARELQLQYGQMFGDEGIRLEALREVLILEALFLDNLAQFFIITRGKKK